MKHHEAWVTYESNILHQWNKDPAFDIPEFQRHLSDLGVTSVSNVEVDEEEEREVSHEMERERQVQQPREAKPATHQVHDDVRELVEQGIFDEDYDAFVQLFWPLRQIGKHEWSPTLMATKDFATTRSAR